MGRGKDFQNVPVKGVNVNFCVFTSFKETLCSTSATYLIIFRYVFSIFFFLESVMFSVGKSVCKASKVLF